MAGEDKSNKDSSKAEKAEEGATRGYHEEQRFGQPYYVADDGSFGNANESYVQERIRAEHMNRVHLEQAGLVK